LIQIRNLKNLNPSHVLSIQIEKKSGGKVRMSMIVSISNMKSGKFSVARARRMKYIRKTIPRTKFV
jgi:hypothetical protein